MGARSKVTTAIKNPKRIAVELNTIWQRRIRSRVGIDVLSEDWDNLVVLDACRFDMFAEMNPFDRPTEKVVSRGSHTNEWLVKNFGSADHLDVIYVSATPQLPRIDARFADIIDLTDTEWNESLGTVPPEAVRDAALEAASDYPEKRLIVHFMQPHAPFIGETGKDIDESSLPQGLDEDNQFGDSYPFARLERGEISSDAVWRGYRENLEAVLPHVQRLVEEFSGKTVVTSDHGNALGEWGEYGHDSAKFLAALVEVPWVTLPTDERKTITTARNGVSPSRTDELEERLAALGYTESD